MPNRNDRHNTYNRKKTPDNRAVNRRSGNVPPNRERARREYPPERQYSKKPVQSKRVVTPNIKHRNVDFNKKRNKDIMRKNQFIGVDDSYLKKNPDAIYSDGFDGFEREFKPAKKRKGLSPAKRKARKISLLIFFAVAAAVTGVVLSLTVFFKTEQITVIYNDKAEHKYTSRQIIEASQLHIGENLFISDKQAASERILNAFPYIESADIFIKLPQTLQISVKQAKPVYYVENGKEYALLGSNDKILETSNKTKYKIPILKGVTLTKTKIGEKASFTEKSVKKILDSIISCAEKNKLTNINEIDLSYLSNITVRYDNRINIVLGTNSAIDYKMRTAIAIMTEKLSKDDKGTLDVSLCSEGKRQSSFLPDDMANTENNIVLPTDTDTQSDSDVSDTDIASDNGDYAETETDIEDWQDYNYGD